MRKALVVLLPLAAAVYVASWFWAGDEVAAAAARPWPEGLGTLAAVPDRYPPQQENEAARKLANLAGRFAENDAIAAYVRQGIARGELAIPEPPTIAEPAIRDLLLREPIVWKRDISIQHGGLLQKVSMYQMTPPKVRVPASLLTVSCRHSAGSKTWLGVLDEYRTAVLAMGLLQ